jgi:AcrR family transcriptional regulator
VAINELTPTPTKSDRTRAAILRAAREQFGQHGYDRASIRAIAAQASVDPALVIRYFTNKESLFSAVVDIDLLVPDLTNVAPSTLGRRLTEHFLARWEGELSDGVLVVLLRSAATNPAAAERLRGVFVDQVIEGLRALGLSDDVERRATLVSSQLLGIALTRYILRLPGIADRPAAELVADVAPTIQRYLTGRLPAVRIR